MRYMLDTNICIYIIRQNPDQVFEHFRTLSPTDLGISAITFSELQYGVSKSRKRAQNQAALLEFLAPLIIADYPAEAASVFGDIKATLESKGQIIGPNDLLIAAHALSIGAKLVTNNTKEFGRIADLEVENWAE